MAGGLLRKSGGVRDECANSTGGGRSLQSSVGDGRGHQERAALHHERRTLVVQPVAVLWGGARAIGCGNESDAVSRQSVQREEAIKLARHIKSWDLPWGLTD